MALIGREKEKEILKICLESDKSEFVVVYGRRRIGKTFLVKEFFESKFTFYATGILNGNKDVQLKTWNNEIRRFGGTGFPDSENWTEAFDGLAFEKKVSMIYVESLTILFASSQCTDTPKASETARAGTSVRSQ